MELNLYLAFIIAAAIMVALPGPSVLLTVAHSISFGWQRAISTVAGETMGIAVQLTVAAIGMTALLNAAAEAFEWLRWTGAGYLVYLGIRQWQSAGKALKINSSSGSRRHLIFQGLVVTTLNPKSLIFIAAFLPQFIDADHPLGLQFAFIVPTFLVITFSVASAWAMVAGSVSIFLKKQRAFQSVLRAGD